MSIDESSLVGFRPVRQFTFGEDVWRRYRRNRLALIGMGIVALLVAIAIAAPLIAPQDPIKVDLNQQWQPPSLRHLFGTDLYGRDLASRVIFGARISLLIGFSVMLISGVIGAALGIVAGYFGGRTDLVVTYLITVRLSLPVILVALTTVALVGSSLWMVILVLGLLKWDRYAVVLRSATQQVRNLDYVTAARAIGCPTWRIIAGEVLPNVSSHLIVVATLEMGSAILLEAALSFLGLGVQPPLPSWGLMISEAKGYMFFSPWLITIPGMALFALVLAINLLGDGVRDVTAPEGRS